jgi:hypothetical protein
VDKVTRKDLRSPEHPSGQQVGRKVEFALAKDDRVRHRIQPCCSFCRTTGGSPWTATDPVAPTLAALTQILEKDAGGNMRFNIQKVEKLARMGDEFRQVRELEIFQLSTDDFAQV